MKLEHLKLLLEGSILQSIEKHGDEKFVATYVIPPKQNTISVKYTAIVAISQRETFYPFLTMDFSFDGFNNHCEAVDCSSSKVEILPQKRKGKPDEELFARSS